MQATDKSEVKLKGIFQDYYINWEASDVDVVSSREIGFIPFFGTMIRHRAVRNYSDLSKFCRRNTPRHIYYSSAYYQKPEEKVMKDKVWLGAELIFDLDADHLAGAEKMTYAEILREVKAHTERLIFKFLLDDLGFDEKDLKLFFSGGRGYHVHVVEDSVYPMNSDARREIANYIRGEGFNPIDIKRSMQEATTRMSGWKEIIDRQLCEFYGDVLENSEKERILSGIIGHKTTFANYMTNLRKSTSVPGSMKKVELLSQSGSLKYRNMDLNDDKVLSYIIDKVKTENQCEIDEPVTTDIHRLIRLPHSLHGKTGLVVKPIDIGEFKKFDPLRDAIADKFRDFDETIEVLQDQTVEFDGRLELLKRGETTVSRALAVFLVASKLAKFI